MPILEEVQLIIIMGCKLGYSIISLHVLPNQVVLISSVLTNEVLLYIAYIETTSMLCMTDILILELPPQYCHPR